MVLGLIHTKILGIDSKEVICMKLSTKGKYGLKAMFELALSPSGEPVSLKYIAKQQNISDQYLEQIFSSLKKAKLVKSVRGAQRSEEHTSELQSRQYLVCRLL